MMGKTLVLFVAVLSYACAETEEKFYYPDHEFDRTELGDSIDRASMTFLKEAYESSDDKNLVASPLGVFTLLNIYAGGAGREGKEEIVKELGARNYSELSGLYGGLISRLALSDPNIFTFANKIYLSDQYTLRSSFEALTAKSRGEVEKISFSNPRAATDVINQWGEEKTRGHIKKPVPEGAITPDTVVALFNVIFFQGQWNVPFKAEDTKDEDFYLDKDTVVKKPMMRLVQPLFYYESNDIEAKIVELPYKEKGFRMVVVLPNEVDGLSSVIGKVQSKGLLTDVFELRPALADIDLRMPKFNINSEFNLKELLPEIGIKKIFEEEAIGIVRDEGVVVSEAYQKAFVKIDEKGATAGAFTGLIAVAISAISQPPEPIKFEVDHPFMFAILQEDKILFVGTYSH